MRPHHRHRRTVQSYHQVAPVCLPLWAYWHHLTNTIELVLPSAHPSARPKRQIDRVSHFCTAHGRKSLYFALGDPFPYNCPFSLGIWTVSNSWFLGPVRVHNPNGITISLAVFAQVTTDRPYTLQCAALPPQNCLFPSRDLDSNLMHGSLGPHESLTQTASQPFLQGSLLWQTDRPADHATRSVTIDLMYVRRS